MSQNTYAASPKCLFHCSPYKAVLLPFLDRSVRLLFCVHLHERTLVFQYTLTSLEREDRKKPVWKISLVSQMKED